MWLDTARQLEHGDAAWHDGHEPTLQQFQLASAKVCKSSRPSNTAIITLYLGIYLLASIGDFRSRPHAAPVVRIVPLEENDAHPVTPELLLRAC